jgi:hypothetical protein
MNIDKQLLIETILYLQNRPYKEVAGLMARYMPIIKELNNLQMESVAEENKKDTTKN